MLCKLRGFMWHQKWLPRKTPMDKGSADKHYDKQFLFTLIVVVFIIGSAIFITAAWLILIGYWAWALFNWIAT